ncbi:hypothetical protein GCM10009579_40540 [Streptomyces javensis]|uniref:Uncharacterized protein n=1 Tax=Streptomyces javensis TaxID=114698 RepID=A0ABP4HSM4_9ACTN
MPGIGDGSAVHPQHPLGPEGVDETGHGAARSDRHHRRGQVRVLYEEFGARRGIAPGAQHTGAAEGDHRGPGAPLAEVAGHVLHGRREFRLAHLARPYDAGAEETVERDVAGHPLGRRTGEDQDHVHAQPGPGRGRQPGVVALGGPAGHQGGGALVAGGPGRPLQLADLVAAAAEADQIVTLDPQIVGLQPDGAGQAWRGLQRRGPTHQLGPRDVLTPRSILAPRGALILCGALTLF